MLSSLLTLANVDLPVPCYRQIQRRASRLSLSKKTSNKRPTDIVIDASGLKVYGEGEWQEERKRQKGRKKWRKIHIAVDPDSGEIVVEEVTDSNCHDSVMLPDLVSESSSRLRRVYADGAYDTSACYKVLHARGIEPKIPPRRGSVTHPSEEHLGSRNDAIRAIVALGGDTEAHQLWKKLTGYGRRSLVKTAFSRFKRSFGERFWSRHPKMQSQEASIKWRLLNHFTRLCRPTSYALLNAR